MTEADPTIISEPTQPPKVDAGRLGSAAVGPGLIVQRRLGDTLTYGFSQGASAAGYKDMGFTADPLDLQVWMLYWDRLAIVRSEDFALTDDEAFLIDCGLLNVVGPEMLNYRLITPGGGAEEARRGQLSLFGKLEVDEPGLWAVASHEPELNLREFYEPGRSIFVRLHEAIPAPSRETPLEEIFRFRERYNGERAVLRSCLEGIYSRILSAEDSPLAYRSEFDALERALSSQIKALDGSNMAVRFVGLEARLKWDIDPIRLIEGGVIGAVAGESSLGGAEGGILGTIAGIIGGLASNLIPRIEIKTGANVLSAARSSPYEYVLLQQRGL